MWTMSESSISVADVAKDFLGLLDRGKRGREAAVLLRESKPVATLSPLPMAAATCSELAERWPSLAKLSPEEACAFAADIEGARAALPPIKPAWDRFLTPLCRLRTSGESSTCPASSDDFRRPCR
jgi:hypothetical protein